jgi:hypothetical protein
MQVVRKRNVDGVNVSALKKVFEIVVVDRSFDVVPF